MQVGVDVKCMHTNFIGCDLPGFEDIASLKFGPNFPSSPSSPLLSLFFQVLGYPLLSAYPSFYGSQSLGVLCSYIFLSCGEKNCLFLVPETNHKLSNKLSYFTVMFVLVYISVSFIRCWAQDPHKRLSAVEIVRKLKRIPYKFKHETPLTRQLFLLTHAFTDFTHSLTTHSFIHSFIHSLHCIIIYLFYFICYRPQEQDRGQETNVIFRYTSNAETYLTPPSSS